MNKDTQATKDVPYPEKPYTYSHKATYASGFVRKLVSWGAKCQDCNSRKTFLDGGRAACREHMDRLCQHGCAACGQCLVFVTNGPISVRKL